MPGRGFPIWAVLIIPVILAPNFVVSNGFRLVNMLVQRIGLRRRQSLPGRSRRPGGARRGRCPVDVPSQLAMSVSPLVTVSCPVVLAGG